MIEGRINADLTCGPDLTKAKALMANRGLASRGVALHGSGFIVTRDRARELGLGRHAGLERHILDYRHGRDIAQRSRDLMVIDLYPLSANEARERYPEVYQHLLRTVKPERDRNNMKSRRDNWHWFGATNEIYRSMTDGLPRFIVTPETARHRIFSFIDAGTRADNKLVAFGSDQAWLLAVMSSRFHRKWATATGGWLGVGNDEVYIKSRCFDTFPFPRLSPEQKQELAAAGEALDGLRKRVLSDHPDLTMTRLYNVLEKIRTRQPLTAKEESAMERGLVLIMAEHHDAIDACVAKAYGLAPELAESELLARLASLNQQRAEEEAHGTVDWLRPGYQMARFAAAGVVKTAALVLETEVREDQANLAWPTDRDEQTLAVGALLRQAGKPMDAVEIARGFRRKGGRSALRIEQALLTLTRYGHVSQLTNRRFVARQVP